MASNASTHPKPGPVVEAGRDRPLCLLRSPNQQQGALCVPALRDRPLATSASRWCDKEMAGMRRVEVWRGGVRLGMSVSAPFVWRCLSGSAVAPFPHPAHRGRPCGPRGYFGGGPVLPFGGQDVHGQCRQRCEVVAAPQRRWQSGGAANGRPQALSCGAREGLGSGADRREARPDATRLRELATAPGGQLLCSLAFSPT